MWDSGFLLCTILTFVSCKHIFVFKIKIKISYKINQYCKPVYFLHSLGKSAINYLPGTLYKLGIGGLNLNFN